MDPFSENAPPDLKGSVSGRSESFSERQLVVIRLIEGIDKRLAVVYRGAREVFNSKQYDYLALAAHGCREVMEKLFFKFNERPMAMGDALKKFVGKPWKAVVRARDKNVLFENPLTLEKFVDGYSQFQEWQVQWIPVKSAKAELLLTGLRKKREKPDTFENDHKDWLRLDQLFIDVAHHRISATDEEFREAMERLDFLLLRYLRPLMTEQFNAIEDLVRAAGSHPTKENLTEIEALIDGWADRDIFLRAIDSAAWIPLLLREDWFNPEADKFSFPDDPSPGSSEIEILAKFVKDIPDDAHAAAMQLSAVANDRVHARLLRLAVELRDDHLDSYVDLARKFVGTGIGHQIQRSLCELLKRKLIGGVTPKVNQLLRESLEFRIDPRFEEKKRARHEDGLAGIMSGLDATPRWEVYQYKEVLKVLVASTRAEDRAEVITILCDTLKNGIDLSIFPEERAERNGNDGSTWWRPAIESHTQNHNFGHREALVSAIRDLSELAVVDEETALEKILSVFDAQDWIIFRRLRLHLIRKFPAVSGALVRDSIFDSKSRDSDAWHEWAILLGQEFGNLATEDQETVLQWVENRGFQPDWRIAYYRENNDGREPEVELVDKWKRNWQFQKLSLIEGALPSEWKARYAALKDEFKDPGHPDFHHWSESSGSSGFHHSSPVPIDDIVALPPSALVEKLDEWAEDRPWGEPSEWGLTSALEAAAKSDLDLFQARLPEYRRLAPQRYEALLKGCIVAARERKSFDWKPLLEEVATAIREVFIPATEKAKAAEEKITIGLDIARNIESLVEADSAVLPIEFRPQIWACICQLLNHPDPTNDRDGTSSPRDWASTTLNSNRLIGFRAVFAYADWVRKVGRHQGTPNSSPEILPVLEERLILESTLAGFSVFGERLSWLLTHHRDWLEQHTDELLPQAESLKQRHDAVWESFLTWTGPTATGHVFFRRDYERVIRELAEPKEDSEARREGYIPERNVVHHLSSFYWWGRIPLREEDTLLARFYTTAPVELKTYLLSYMGKSLRSTEGEIEAEYLDRFRALMDYRFEVLSAHDISSADRAELRGFLPWVSSQKLPAEWALQTLLQVLDLAPKPPEYDSDFLEEALAHYAPERADLAVKCLRKLALSDQKLPDWWDESPIKTVLKEGLASTDSQVRAMAEEILDALLKAGRVTYRELDSTDL